MRPFPDLITARVSAQSTSYNAIAKYSGYRWSCSPCQPYRRGLLNSQSRLHTSPRQPRIVVLRASVKDDPPCSNTQGASASGTSPAPDQAAQDFELASVWETVKKDFQKGLSAEDAQILESIKVDDLMGDSRHLMKKLADEQLGPLLKSLGVHDDPLEFFMDLLRLATALQLLSGGALFYGAELCGGLDSGEAFRCVCGLTAGYLSRPCFKVEQVFWPLYDWGLKILVPGAVYEVQTSREESAQTLTRLGVTVAACSLVPQAALGWDSATSLQFVLPLAAGWLLFDVAYAAALVKKLQRD